MVYYLAQCLDQSKCSVNPSAAASAAADSTRPGEQDDVQEEQENGFRALMAPQTSR